MNRFAQTLIGIVFGLLGIFVTCAALYIMFLAKAPTMWGVILALCGLGVLFWGGVIVPNSGVEDGGKKLTVLVGPLLPLLPGGRRMTDQATAVVVTTTKADP